MVESYLSFMLILSILLRLLRFLLLLLLLRLCRHRYNPILFRYQGHGIFIHKLPINNHIILQTPFLNESQLLQYSFRGEIFRKNRSTNFMNFEILQEKLDSTAQCFSSISLSPILWIDDIRNFRKVKTTIELD